MEFPVLDYTLRAYLQRILNRLPLNLQEQTRSIRLCGHRVNKASIAGTDGVFLLSNGSQAKFFGTSHCQNPFVCPCCSARRMSKFATEIGMAIKILSKKGYVGIMITFTLPHLPFMKCREITDILVNTYQKFRTNLKTYSQGRNRTPSKEAEFTLDVGLKHHVSVYEYTWGNNGWHPHIHGIFWLPKKNLSKVGKWEKILHERWLFWGKKETVKYWKKHGIFKGYEQEKADWLYKVVNQKRGGLYMSKDSKGNVRESAASEYICGWGSDKEVTGNYRKNATNEGHYTPYQILEKAYHGDKKCEKLIIEFALSITTKPYHFRIRWSQTGIKKLVAQQLQIENCEELIKKKEHEKWKVLLWFSREDWSYISRYEKNSPVIANILYLAARDSNLLFEFLDFLRIPYKSAESHYFSAHVEDIFNDAA